MSLTDQNSVDSGMCAGSELQARPLGIFHDIKLTLYVRSFTHQSCHAFVSYIHGTQTCQTHDPHKLRLFSK